MNRREIYVLILILAAAFALRVCFIPAAGYEQDIHNFKSWSQAAVEHGIHNIYDRTDCDYPPAYIYVLKTVGYSYRIFYPKFNEHTYLFDLMVKFPAILADLIISFIVFWFLRKKNSFVISLAAMAAYAFNPVIIFNSAYWGQVDSVSSLLALGAILALINDKYGLAWGLITIGILTKIQLFVLLPVMILIPWKRNGFKQLVNSMAYAWCTFVFILLPFFRFHQVDRVIERVFKAVGEYPFLSLYAFNIWWLFSGGQGRWAPDMRLFLGLFSYRTLGTMLLGIFFILLVRYLYSREKDENAVFLCSAMAFIGFFMLPTEMHERYIMPAFVFLVLAAVKNRSLMAVYAALSLTTFFNLLIALIWTYPKNFPMVPYFIQASPTGIIISMVNVALFIFVLFLLSKEVNVKYFGCSLAAILIVLSGLYFLKPVHPVYLSDLTPKAYEQQWGQLHMDRSVDGNPLTVNGFKYLKGIGTHANSSIEYIMDGRYRVLEGAVSMDDEQKRDNKIEARIYADNKLIYQSGILKGWIDPRYFRLNIKGVKEIKLVFSDGGDGINFDHGDWLRIKALP